ncbi:hypothetical protein GCM10010342_50190 [Streptomyces anulatus]|nr:hypothetical protein GCM10010342_50190 [Streptomyces anulatus]
MIGYNDQPFGYAYGALLPLGSRWWGGLLTQVPADVTAGDVHDFGRRLFTTSDGTVPWHCSIGRRGLGTTR